MTINDRYKESRFVLATKKNFGFSENGFNPLHFNESEKKNKRRAFGLQKF